MKMIGATFELWDFAVIQHHPDLMGFLIFQCDFMN